MEAFTTTFAVEVASRGITVNAVNPGPTDTGWMTEDLKRDLLSRFPPEGSVSRRTPPGLSFFSPERKPNGSRDR